MCEISGAKNERNIIMANKKANWITCEHCDCVNHPENEDCVGCGSPLPLNQSKENKHSAPAATPTVDVTPKSDPADSIWQKLGKITIDTGRLLLIDPIHDIADVDELIEADFAQVPIPGGDYSAVVVGTGMGDGRYTVEGRYVACPFGRRIAEIRVRFLDDHGGYLGADKEGEAARKK
jgi:hypothetical protein